MSNHEQFYFPLHIKDILGNPKLAACSKSTVGVYIYLLCILHQSPVRWHLCNDDGSPLSHKHIAKFLHMKPSLFRKAINELLQTGVLQSWDDGVIYSALHLERDVAKEKDRENGRKGGNPALKRSPKPPSRTKKSSISSRSTFTPPNPHCLPKANFDKLANDAVAAFHKTRGRI